MTTLHAAVRNRQITPEQAYIVYYLNEFGMHTKERLAEALGLSIGKIQRILTALHLSGFVIHMRGNWIARIDQSLHNIDQPSDHRDLPKIDTTIRPDTCEMDEPSVDDITAMASELIDDVDMPAEEKPKLAAALVRGLVKPKFPWIPSVIKDAWSDATYHTLDEGRGVRSLYGWFVNLTRMRLCDAISTDALRRTYREKCLKAFQLEPKMAG